MATSGTIRAEERRARLLAALNRDGAVQLDSAAVELQVSIMTVRRDLDELESEGLVRRVRGGAIAADQPRSFDDRRAVRSRAKQAIALKAAKLVPDAGSIALDASSTTGAIGAVLHGRSQLTVATNSYDNFATLRRIAGVRAVLIGGEAEESTGSFVGFLACEAAASMLYERLFVSASALVPAHGTSEVSLAESQVKRAFAGRARETVLCVDSSKLGQRSIAVGFDLREIAVMITELDPQDARLSEYRPLVELL